MDDVKPIQWYNLISWARQTANQDRKSYQTAQRPLSANRLWHQLVPDLRYPIFLVGAPRSGTTFLGDSLAQLPELSYHFEPVATKAAARYVYRGLWTQAQAKRFYCSVYAWLMRLHCDGDLRFAEKTPRNCFIMDFLASAFPDAQFIQIIRDGRDAALSYSQKPWLQAKSADTNRREPGGFRFGPFPRFWVESGRVEEFQQTSDIHRCIWAWRRHTESALMSGQQLPGSRYHELRYESLVCQPQQEGERLLDFLGITAARSRDRFYQSLAKAKSDSVERWKHELLNEQLQQIEQEASKLLHQLGYT